MKVVYNKAEYREQRTVVLQDWVDMIDEWTVGSAPDIFSCNLTH